MPPNAPFGVLRWVARHGHGVGGSQHSRPPPDHTRGGRRLDVTRGIRRMHTGYGGRLELFGVFGGSASDAGWTVMEMSGENVALAVEGVNGGWSRRA